MHIPSFQVEWSVVNASCYFLNVKVDRFISTYDGEFTNVFFVRCCVVVTFDFEFTPTVNVLYTSDAIVERYFCRTVCDDHIPNVFPFDGQFDGFLKSSPVKSA